MTAIQVRRSEVQMPFTLGCYPTSSSSFPSGKISRIVCRSDLEDSNQFLSAVRRPHFLQSLQRPDQHTTRVSRPKTESHKESGTSPPHALLLSPFAFSCTAESGSTGSRVASQSLSVRHREFFRGAGAQIAPVTKMRRCVRPRVEMVSLLALAAGIAVLSGVRADDEVQGEDAQTVTASVSGTLTGYGNEADDL